MNVEIKNFVCSECGKAFDKNQKMLLHHRMAHVLWKNLAWITESKRKRSTQTCKI